MKKEEIEPGMVFTFGNNPEIEYVVTGIYPNSASMERINHRREGSNRHGCGYGWFEYPATVLVRKMNETELSSYLTKDPICNLEKGIYRVKKNTDTLLEQPAIEEGEVIRVLAAGWEDYQGCKGEQYKLEVVYQQFGRKKSGRLTFHSEEKTGCIHWFWDNFHKIDIDQ